MNILVTDSVAIRDAYIRNEGFAEVTSGVYQSSKDTLYFNEKITVPFIRSVFSASKKMAERIEESQ